MRARDLCHVCEKPLGASYSFTLTWVGGPPQLAFCRRRVCRLRQRVHRQVTTVRLRVSRALRRWSDWLNVPWRERW